MADPTGYGAIPVHHDHDDHYESSDDEQAVENSIHAHRHAPSVVSTIRSTVRSAMVFTGGFNASVRELSGQASVGSEVFNIAKNLIGSGVLSLPGGMAMYSNQPSAVVSGTILIVIFGSVCAYYCVMVARICRITRAFSYVECWDKTLGEKKGSLVVAIVIATYPALGCLGCSIILSDTFSSLSETIDYPVSRVHCLLLVTVVALLPLCLLKSMAPLAPFSCFGVVVTALAAIAMVTRCIDGSYTHGGQYYDDVPTEFKPDFGERNDLFGLSVLPFICMIFAAYVMHYNSARFYVELKDASVPRFTTAVSGSFGLTTFIYIIMAAAGFLTFGGHSDSLILNNYSPHDPLATFCRLAIAVSVLLNFPASFIGFRDAVLDVFKIPIRLQTSHNIDMLTVILLTLITTVAACVTDLGMVNALAGGLFGIAIVFVFPTVMFRAMLNNVSLINSETAMFRAMMRNASIMDPEKEKPKDAPLATGLMILGVFIGVVGTFVSVFGGK
mmetsp:Transcript_30823/g.66740  ORF Transcript_30823/g.66740 Transcript_30823/m.66740 type:complete len:500 (-) Transcript_30823:53-1552(-)